MLEEANIPFASMQYSHSIYGKADLQHNLITGILETVKPIKSHKISIYDDFIDDPFLQLYFPNNSGITAIVKL
jgi:UDP-N-acetyl-alpha-D-muramoyl-L-alanyl-L-glutamate epimerase